MFIGHLIGAELANALTPQTPLWVSLTGTSFPDFLWGVTVHVGLEKVEIDPASPLQSRIRFVYYPYSHSLVLGNILASLPATLIGIYCHSVTAAFVFVLASVSHWLLDAIVHLPDLPVLGFGEDVKVGLGLWRHGPLAFALEYGLVVASTLALQPKRLWPAILIASFVFHAANANTFFGFTRTNPVKSSRSYATMALVGFVALILVFDWIL
jgi:hypothetical protein